jgi:fumarate hydratase class II
MTYRIEHDTMGEVMVPADKYWGAQTQRSFQNFKIGTENMPQEIITAFAVIKKAASLVNMQLCSIDEKRGNLIVAVCDEILSGDLDDNFPLVVWQTGSGTQSDMNVNEVIANRANELAGEKLIHPNDHVNRGQSSNDTFPTAMHIAAVVSIEMNLLPSLRVLKKTFKNLSEENSHVIKVGRTHLQDATPLTLGQEISGWYEMLDKCEQMINISLSGIKELALGGTAVGTGLNTHSKFGELSAAEISKITRINFCSADNKFHALTSKDALVFSHGALKALAANLMKIANDIRMLASGPRCGIGEIDIPENEPGSSIMPGKVNPTQCEAVTMVAVQVIANDMAVAMAASQGNFELNVFMPVCIYNFLQSVRLLGDVMRSFEINCARGIKANLSVINDYLNKSLMLATALTPVIGYENTAKIAKTAYDENLTLKEASIKLGFINAEEFDKAVRPENMLNSYE